MVTHHANQYGHDIDFDHASVVDKAHHCHKRLFFSKHGILRETEMRAVNILTYQIFRHPYDLLSRAAFAH